jgi:hypothetical protein
MQHRLGSVGRCSEADAGWLCREHSGQAASERLVRSSLDQRGAVCAIGPVRESGAEFRLGQIETLLPFLMGQKKYPTLAPTESTSILVKPGFFKDRQDVSHQQRECPKSERYPRTVVTVDDSYQRFSEERMKNTIRQSKRPRDEFYGATKRSALKGLATPRFLGWRQ